MSRNIEKLRILCVVGTDPWYSNLLTPIECCEILLSQSEFNEKLEISPGKWINLAKDILPLVEDSKKCAETFKILLAHILQHENLEGKQDFLNYLWKYLETEALPYQEILDDLSRNSPEYLEIKIINIFQEMVAVNEINPWNKNVALIRWCSISSVVFQSVTSMMNEILERVLKTNFEVFLKFLNVAKNLTDSVSKMCEAENRDLVDLYPWRLKGLVCLLKFDKEDTEIRSTLIEMILPVLKRLHASAEVSILLTHYPRWLP